MKGLAVNRCRSTSSPGSTSPAAAALEMVRPSSRIRSAVATAAATGLSAGVARASLSSRGRRCSDRLEVGQDQLGVDRLDVTHRVERASTWTTSWSWKARTTWQIASVSRMAARNWLPSPSPRDAPLYQPGDVDEGDRRRHDRRVLVQLGQRVQPRIGHRDHPDVGVDGRERVVGRQDTVVRQGVEEGRLADIGETDDPDRQRHGVG